MKYGFRSGRCEASKAGFGDKFDYRNVDTYYATVFADGDVVAPNIATAIQASVGASDEKATIELKMCSGNNNTIAVTVLERNENGECVEKKFDNAYGVEIAADKETGEKIIGGLGISIDGFMGKGTVKLERQDLIIPDEMNDPEESFKAAMKTMYGVTYEEDDTEC